jgi:hypothetical protein
MPTAKNFKPTKKTVSPDFALARKLVDAEWRSNETILYSGHVKKTYIIRQWTSGLLYDCTSSHKGDRAWVWQDKWKIVFVSTDRKEAYKQLKRWQVDIEYGIFDIRGYALPSDFQLSNIAVKSVSIPSSWGGMKSEERRALSGGKGLFRSFERAGGFFGKFDPTCRDIDYAVSIIQQRVDTEWFTVHVDKVSCTYERIAHLHRLDHKVKSLRKKARKGSKFRIVHCTFPGGYEMSPVELVC